jgi:RHS repeat-associated protein
VVYSCFYTPFGKVIDETGTKPSPYGFSTKPLDSETGLVYYIFRDYSPELGRWISRDPIEEEGGWNVYGFVENDAVNKWDYMGNYWIDRNIFDPVIDAVGTTIYGISDAAYWTWDKLTSSDCEEVGGDDNSGSCCCNGNTLTPKTHCCEVGNIVKKVSIWIVNRRLSSPNSGIPRIGPLSHSYVSSEDPTQYSTKKCGYGKQPHKKYNPKNNPIWGPGYITPEFFDYDGTIMDSKKVEVCPAIKKYLTTAGKAKSFYFLLSPWNNCHGSANDTQYDSGYFR